MNIKFRYDELESAVDWVKYCRNHNVNCSHLKNDNSCYSVTVHAEDVKKLSMYFLIDSQPNTKAALARIVDSLIN